MSLIIVPAYDHPEEIRALFREYTEMLVENDPSFAEYLVIQNYDKEIDDLSYKYGMPDGRLYLAYYEGAAAGCIAIRKLDSENCEMKRLYVRPQFRGKQIAARLLQQILSDARRIGYSHMLLDTLPFLDVAITIYKKLGFYEIPKYNDSPLDTTIYMKLDL